MQRYTTQWLIPILLAVGAAGGLWYYWMQANRAPEPVTPPVVVTPQQPAEGLQPIHPLTIPEQDGARPELRSLPPLDESDEYFKLELSDLFGDAVADILAESGLIERVVATVDNLPRAHVAEKIRPVGRLNGQFTVGAELENDRFEMSAENYRRYDRLVELITAVDTDRLADMYRRFYPLMQSAYLQLGYPDGYFNDRVVEVIDHLLETPQPERPIVLLRPHVLYQYADPDFEDLSSGQKLLLRMGSEHAASIKQVLREMRSRITEQHQ